MAWIAFGCDDGEGGEVDAGRKQLCGYLAAADTFTCNWNDPPPPELCDENGVCCNGVAQDCLDQGRYVCCDPRDGTLTYQCRGDGGMVTEVYQCEEPPDAGPPPCGYIAEFDTYACGSRDDPLPAGRVCYDPTKCCVGSIGDCSEGDVLLCCNKARRELTLTCMDGVYMNWESIPCE